MRKVLRTMLGSCPCNSKYIPHSVPPMLVRLRRQLVTTVVYSTASKPFSPIVESGRHMSIIATSPTSPTYFTSLPSPPSVTLIQSKTYEGVLPPLRDSMVSGAALLLYTGISQCTHTTCQKHPQDIPKARTSHIKIFTARHTAHQKSIPCVKSTHTRMYRPVHILNMSRSKCSVPTARRLSSSSFDLPRHIHVLRINSYWY